MCFHHNGLKHHHKNNYPSSILFRSKLSRMFLEELTAQSTWKYTAADGIAPCAREKKA